MIYIYIYIEREKDVYIQRERDIDKYLGSTERSMEFIVFLHVLHKALCLLVFSSLVEHSSAQWS